MSNDKLKERMADILPCPESNKDFCDYAFGCDKCLKLSILIDQILADPEIKRGLELLELEKHGKLAELADNQETPPNPYPDGVGRANIYGREFRVHQTIQQDMISAGWLKCKPREVK